jgi:hypothetical protein
MQAIHFNWSMFRPVRWLATAFVCTLLMFSNAFPAFAAQSSPTKGEEQLTNIEKKAQETTMEKPLSRGEVEAETNPGENEIQGTADAEKMYRPETSKTPGVEERIKSALEKVQGKG